MQRKYGNDWIATEIPKVTFGTKTGTNTIKDWEKTKSREGDKQKYGVVEERLIYFAEFSELKPILNTYWDTDFKVIFDVEWVKMEMWFDALYLVRNPLAHAREILDYQKHSALGAAGEIRTRYIRYRSKMETAEDYFPRILRVNNDLGDIWTSGTDKTVQTGRTLREGDTLTFTISADDPRGGTLQYALVSTWKGDLDWCDTNVQSIPLTRPDVGIDSKLAVHIRSTNGRDHAYGNYDDSVTFMYDILPLDRLKAT